MERDDTICVPSGHEVGVAEVTGGAVGDSSHCPLLKAIAAASIRPNTIRGDRPKENRL